MSYEDPYERIRPYELTEDDWAELHRRTVRPDDKAEAIADQCVALAIAALVGLVLMIAHLLGAL